MTEAEREAARAEAREQIAQLPPDPDPQLVTDLAAIRAAARERQLRKDRQRAPQGGPPEEASER